jgi:AraC-like DNA-binding protein
VRKKGLPPGEDELFSEEAALFLMRFGVRAMAEKRCVSERTLRRQFERFGLGIEEHLAGIRRALIPRLLASKTPLSDVAAQLGFASAKTLARYVQREFGLSPRELRRKCQRREKEEKE